MADEPTPLPPAGWYPDPEQVQTQRYWTGAEWTDQRAPVAAPPPRTTGTIAVWMWFAIGGAVLAVIGTFLPHLESDTFFEIVDNTLIQSGDGFIVVALAAAGAVFAYASRDKRRSIAVVLFGALIVALAIYDGTGDRTKLGSANPSFENLEDFRQGGETDDGSPGVGLYVVGLGGLVMAGAGLVGRPD